MVRRDDSRRLGRPPLPADERLSVALIARVNPLTAATFHTHRQRLGLTEAELLRRLIVHGLEDLHDGWRP